MAQVWRQVGETGLGQDAKGRSTADNGGRTQRPQMAYKRSDGREVADRIQVTLVVQVAQRQPDHLGLETLHSLRDVCMRILGEHQIQHLQGMAGFVDVGRNIGQANRQRPHRHAVHIAAGLIGSNEQHLHAHIPRMGQPMHSRIRLL